MSLRVRSADAEHRGVVIKPLGHVVQLVRYPVKSMAGTAVESIFLGWHGLVGDRRLAFRRLGEQNGFPWLTASRMPELLLYHPFGLDDSTGEPLATHVRTPAGAQVELQSAALQRQVSESYGGNVELMQLRNGIFDDACVSVISRATIGAIGREFEMELDPRRFRANILLETHESEPFQEDRWVGGRLVFGGSEPRPVVSVTAHDVRCRMINIDPDTAKQDAGVLKAIVRLNGNNAGVYGTVVRTGTISAGQTVNLVLD